MLEIENREAMKKFPAKPIVEETEVTEIEVTEIEAVETEDSDSEEILAEDTEVTEEEPVASFVTPVNAPSAHTSKSKNRGRK